MSDFEEDALPGRSLAALALLEATAGNREAGAMQTLLRIDESAVEGRTRDFEAAVDRLAAGRGAGLFDGAAVRSGYRAAFYSGLFQEVGYSIRRMASAEGAGQSAAALATPGSGTAEELKRWIEVKGQMLGGSGDSRPVAELLASAKSIGAAPLFDLAIAQRTGGTDPDAAAADPGPVRAAGHPAVASRDGRRAWRGGT